MTAKPLANSRAPVVECSHCKTIAVGCGSLDTARGAEPHTEKSAVFSILATSFGSSDGRAKALSATLRVPPTLPHPSELPTPRGSGAAVVHQARLEHSMHSKFLFFLFGRRRCVAAGKAVA